MQTQLDNTPSLTVFIPSNAAFSSANISPNTTAEDLAKAFGGHVVQTTQENPQPIGYLPNLNHGQTLISNAGTQLRISVKGDDYFVNNAKITKANMVLQNGVAHMIDSVSFLKLLY